MKKIKTTILFIISLVSVNCSYAQLTTVEVEEVKEIVCEPIDDIFNLECPKYQMEVTGTNNYTFAIRKAITDANTNGGGVILFPGNKIVVTDSVISVHSNITFKASHSTATIKCSDTFIGSQLIVLGNRQNVTFQGVKFDSNKKAIGIAAYGTSNVNINIIDCAFENAGDANNSKFYSGIQMQNVTDVNIKDCEFRGGFYGISLLKNNTRVYIENNKFENTLDDSAIRIHGSQTGEYSNHVWISGNDIRVGRSPSIIAALDSLTRNEVGAVLGLGSVNGNPEIPATDTTAVVPADPNYNAEYYTWRNGHQKGHYAIDITCKDSIGGPGLVNHENIVVENNIAIGPDYGFFDGGSGDLYALKDIVRLKCVNNVARNSGDLGFAIVNCTGAVVSGNTADRNNSAGVGIFDSRNSVFTGNVFDNNGLRRDYMYNSTPYGAILITGGKSYNNIIEGNHFYAFKPIDISLPINDTIPPSTNDYTVRKSATEYYGIVIRPNFLDVGSGAPEINFSASPFLNKIGDNHYAGLKWGPIYNPIPSTILTDDFSATTFPTNQDYPLGTWVRNSNMNNSALGWSVVNRVETELHNDWTGGTHIDVKDDSNSIQKDDVFGVMLDDGNVHWSIIDEIIPQTGYYQVKLATSPPSNLTAAGIEDPAPSRTQTPGYGMGRIVILRWLTVTK